MRDIWRSGDNKSAIIYQGKPVDIITLIKPRKKKKGESLFYIYQPNGC